MRRIATADGGACCAQPCPSLSPVDYVNTTDLVQWLMERAAIYLRLSKDDGRSGEANSIEGQRRDCLAYAGRSGWRAVTEYLDEMSASKGLDRPAYSAMLAAMVAGELDHIVAAKQDRFTRDRDVEFGELKSLAQRAGVQVHTADAGPLRLDTPDGALSTGIRAEFAQFEARLIGVRTRRGLQTRREQGEWTGGGRCFGYLNRGVVNTEQADHIRWAYSQILDHGKSIRHVFDTWRQQGVLTATGKPWTSADRVAAMLRSPTIAGIVTHEGQVLDVEGKWQPIVSPDEQARLSAAIAAGVRGDRGYGQRKPRKHWLAGLVLCGNPECDLRTMSSHNPGNGREHYWVCDKRRGGCGNRARNPRLEELVVQAAIALLLKSPAPNPALSAFDDGPLRGIEAQIAATRAALADRSMLVVDGAPILRDLRVQLLQQQAAQTEHLAAQRVSDNWHNTQAWAIHDRNPETIRAVVDSVKVLPDRGGVIVEGVNRRVVEIDAKEYQRESPRGRFARPSRVVVRPLAID
jgi:site-specific DNA recombinase